MVLFGILISQMVPGIVVANALYSAYNDIGLLNSYPGLILADATAGIPFGILVMRAFMGNLPASVIEAARVDGAGQLRAFISIVLPMSRNALITAALFTFLFSWSDFLFALTLTTTDTIRPVTLGLYQYIGTYVSNWSAVMATAVLASIPARRPAARRRPAIRRGWRHGRRRQMKGRPLSDKPIRVTVWGENRHEKLEEQVAKIYPDGMHTTIAEGIVANLGDRVRVRTATLDDPEHGLTEEILADRHRRTDLVGPRRACRGGRRGRRAGAPPRTVRARAGRAALRTLVEDLRQVDGHFLHPALAQCA